MTGPKPCITNGGILLANSMFWPCPHPNFPGSPFMGSFRLPLMLLPQAVGGKTVNLPTVSLLGLGRIGLRVCFPNSDPQRALMRRGAAGWGQTGSDDPAVGAKGLAVDPAA